MLDKKTIIIIFLMGLILAIGGVYAYNNISQKAYAQGINDATLSMNRQILNSLQQSGYVPFYYVENNQTYQLKLIVEEKK